MTGAVVEFEIFYDLGEESDPWEIASVKCLEDAKAMMERFAMQVPGRYFVWDSFNGEVIAQINSIS
jgi:hypothetical protein